MNESRIINSDLLSNASLSNFCPLSNQEKLMKINLAQLDQVEMDKVNVDLAAAGVAFKERYNMPVIAEAVEREQPEHLRSWFRERLIAHRLASVSLSRLPYEPKMK
ncbi:DNA polymerase III, theta subunit (modular protein) [Escherichia fergusonii ATCC 35469]|uniref:DNA polymerase III subunit theta n=2 Tax=Escherichia fergusonii TaxID=564 RepID=B7LPK2_ESCF3|nr:DNA polymerase III, theta subunit (modular protein) [Escherichia fergusonii ATCC 35469]